MNIDYISQYFVLTAKQINQFELLMPFYTEWNARINVISRKDLSNLYLHHVLHSLSILKFIIPDRGDRIVDIGTGGGFPGIPLSIMMPEVRFLLVDSKIKKIRVVEALVNNLQLTNVETSACRIEQISRVKFNYAVSRSVSSTANILKWSHDLIESGDPKSKNGLILLKGGNIQNDTSFLKQCKLNYEIVPIDTFFKHPYFKNKFILYIPFLRGKEK